MQNGDVMELDLWVMWIAVIALAFILWFWWNRGLSLRKIWISLRNQIRSGFGVVGVDELEAVQHDLRHLEQQMHSRLSHLEALVKFSPHFQEHHHEIRQSFLPSAPSNTTTSPMPSTSSRPRTIVWGGLRFTLSDSLWSHTGVISGEDVGLNDSHIQNMVQGPFCRVCLKRLVGRATDPAAEIPAQCRHCGVSWSRQTPDALRISLVDLKRQVYLSLVQEFRTGGSVQEVKLPSL